MRVLFTAAPGYGHVQPMLPLAEELRSSGHEVALASGPSLVPRMEAAGFRSFAAGWDLPDWFAELARRQPDRPWELLPPERILQFFTPHLFGEIGAPATLTDLVPIVGQWRPDLLIHDSYELAGPVVGRLAGIPTVHHTVSPLPGVDVQLLTTEAVAPMWREHGLSPEPAFGLGTDLCLDICPPGLRNPEAVSGGEVMPVRPIPVAAVGTEGVPAWVEALPEQPTVHLTLGTSVTNADQSVLVTILEGLHGLPLNVVVTVGPGNDPAVLGSQPANVHVERYLAHRVLLPLCDLVVSHGGAGTMLAALSHGLPLLSVPQGADQYLNAALCQARGVGRTLVVAELTPQRAREEVQLLLDEPGSRLHAREVQAEIAAMPPPQEAVPVLERLAADGAAARAGSTTG